MEPHQMAVPTNHNLGGRVIQLVSYLIDMKNYRGFQGYSPIHVLFKLVKDKRTFDTPIKCLLVVPEKFENSVFHMFHDTLLGAHYGPVNTYYTIKDRYWIHNMFEKLQ